MTALATDGVGACSNNRDVLKDWRLVERTNPKMCRIQTQRNQPTSTHQPTRTGKQTVHTNTNTQTHTAKSTHKKRTNKATSTKHKPEREGAKLVAA